MPTFSRVWNMAYLTLESQYSTERLFCMLSPWQAPWNTKSWRLQLTSCRKSALAPENTPFSNSLGFCYPSVHRNNQSWLNLQTRKVSWCWEGTGQLKPTANKQCPDTSHKTCHVLRMAAQRISHSQHESAMPTAGYTEREFHTVPSRGQGRCMAHTRKYTCPPYLLLSVPSPIIPLCPFQAEQYQSRIAWRGKKKTIISFKNIT